MFFPRPFFTSIGEDIQKSQFSNYEALGYEGIIYMHFPSLYRLNYCHYSSCSLCWIMNYTSRSLFILALGLVLSSCKPTTDPIDAIFHDYDGARPGASLMVIRDGNIILTRSYGMADLEEDVAVTDSTNFRLASMTKAFTAMSVLQLIESGELTFNSVMTDIFPDFPTYGEIITIGQLLHHTSGLYDYEDFIPDTLTGQLLDADVLEMMKAQTTVIYEPGTQFKYSNSGYAVLSQIVEKISGMSFPDYLDMYIFKPLGMQGSLAYMKGEPTFPNRAMGYFVKDDTVRFRDQSRTSAVLGDGGIYSSTRDLYRWDQVLYTDQLVSEALMDSAFTPWLNDYGCGWRVDTYEEHRRIHHSGSSSGFRNIYQRFPDDRFSVILLTNRQGPDAVPLANQVVDLLLLNKRGE